jgi:hypothetical protein
VLPPVLVAPLVPAPVPATPPVPDCALPPLPDVPPWPDVPPLPPDPAVPELPPVAVVPDAPAVPEAPPVEEGTGVSEEQATPWSDRAVTSESTARMNGLLARRARVSNTKLRQSDRVPSPAQLPLLRSAVPQHAACGPRIRWASTE